MGINMVDSRFRAVENNFARLKRQFLTGELSREQFAQALRELRLLDDQGRCWMIGAQTGRWYYYDGKNWIQSTPPISEVSYVVCSACGAYNKSDSEFCAECGRVLTGSKSEITCPECGYLFKSGETVCPVCGLKLSPGEVRLQPQTTEVSLVTPADSGGSWAIKSVDYKSFLLFFGGLGIFIGMVLGLVAGATEFFSSVISALPGFFQDIQGKMLGGLIFSLAGGLLGFVLFALTGAALALLINASIYFLGGPVIHLKRSEKSISKKS